MVLSKWLVGLWHPRSGQRQHSDQDAYEDCPLCQHGTLTTLALMDAMSCDFCRHIFSIDVNQPMIQPPVLKVEDVSQPLTWQWTGTRWQALPQADRSLILWLWIFCGAIATIPSTLMFVATHLFPASGRESWFPALWFYLTVGGHLFSALWFLAEHYQWPFYYRLKLLFVRGLRDRSLE